MVVMIPTDEEVADSIAPTTIRGVIVSLRPVG